MSLREIRFYKGLSQYDITLRTGIPQSKISLIERGYVQPGDDEKERIAKALKCRVGEVFPETQGG